MKLTPHCIVRAWSPTQNLAPGHENQVSINARSDMVVAQALPALAECVRLGRSFGVIGPTEIPVNDIPTTTAALVVWNGEPDGGRCYVIESVFCIGVQVDSTENLAIVGQLNLGRKANPAATPLLSFAAATFTRSTTGTYQTGASTLASAAIDVLRYEDLGDGYGPMALIEGARTNILLWSEVIGSWTGSQALTSITANYAVAPDGTTTADRMIADGTAGLAATRYQSIATVGTHSYTYSQWITNGATGQAADHSVGIADGGGLPAANVTNVVAKSTWTRGAFSKAGIVGGITAAPCVDPNGNDNPAATAGDDAVVWGGQVEQDALFPSSYIPTTTVSVTRQPDTLIVAAANITSGFLAGAWEWYVRPEFGSADLINGDDFLLLDFSGVGDNMRIGRDGTGTHVQINAGGAQVVLSGYITFSRNQPLRMIVNCAAGTLTISGATAGDGITIGTQWAWPAGQDVRIGGINGGASEGFCAFTQPMPVSFVPRSLIGNLGYLGNAVVLSDVVVTNDNAWQALGSSSIADGVEAVSSPQEGRIVVPPGHMLGISGLASDVDKVTMRIGMRWHEVQMPVGPGGGSR